MFKHCFTAEGGEALTFKIYKGHTIKEVLEKCRKDGFVPDSIDEWDEKDHLINTYFVK